MRTSDILFLRRWRKTRIANRASLFAKDDSGSLVIFSLFLFIVMIAMSGMAVDLMRHEQARVNAQNTLDSAIIAASSISQTSDAEAVVKEYVSKAGMDPSLVTVKSFDAKANGQTLTGRTVGARMAFHSDTMFMSMMGIDKLPGYSFGVAEEGASLIEIALVLDISGSMNDNGKLDKLKQAAKQFVTTILESNEQDRVMFSIIPYNQQVRMSQDLRNRMAFHTWNVSVTNKKDHPGDVKSFSFADPDTLCASFSDADMETRSVSNRNQNALTPSAVFVDDYFSHDGYGFINQAFETPFPATQWCGAYGAEMLLYKNEELQLHNFIDSLVAFEGTAIDYGMNWGVGVLDPSFRTVVNGMVQDGHSPESMRNHPLAYNDPDVQKYVVLMTDGMNTSQFDLKYAYKAGASPIYYSPSLALGTNPCAGGCDYKGLMNIAQPALDLLKTSWTGFAVKMPDNAASQRWFVPGSPFTTADDYYLAENQLPVDAQQLLYRDVYKRFRTNDVPSFFFYTAGDTERWNAHWDVVQNRGTAENGQGNVRLQKSCTAAKQNDGITVFTVAFEAPEDGNAQLQTCATSTGHHFDVDVTDISDAFSAIAVQISVLKLKE